MLSIWEKETYFAPVDVLVVGGGLLGWWSAFEMKKHHPNARVLVIEKGALPEGASTRNAGFACFGSPSELMHDLDVMGEDDLLRVVEMRFKGIEKIRHVLGDGAIDYDDCGGYECFTEPPPQLEEHLQTLNQLLQQVLHSPSSFGLVTKKLKTLGLQGFGALVENHMEGGVHSGRLLIALRRLAQASGVLYRGGETMLSFTPNGGAVAVQLQKSQLYARRVVVATNAYLSQSFPELGIVPARGQMLLTRPVQGLMLTGTFHFDGGFYYWRNLGNRVLIGGARNTDMAAEQTLEHLTSIPVQRALEQFLCRHLPQHFTPENMDHLVEMRWSGLMAMSPDKQPVLTPVAEGVWAAMCCNGMGLALSPVFAELVAAAVTDGL